MALPRRFSCASLAMVYPPGQYSRHHGGVCTWCSANIRDTPCRGDVSSAVLTFCECGTCVTAIAPRWCTAVEVTDDARPQRPGPNDEPYDTCTETVRD